MAEEKKLPEQKVIINSKRSKARTQEIVSEIVAKPNQREQPSAAERAAMIDRVMNWNVNDIIRFVSALLQELSLHPAPQFRFGSREYKDALGEAQRQLTNVGTNTKRR